jgi:hypothetical protein
MIENRNLTKGMRLTARYHKQDYSCEVVEGEVGKLRYRLEDGREFKSPSAAGMAITSGSCNGWAFWSVAVDAKPAETPLETKPAETTTATVAPAETPVSPATQVINLAAEHPTIEPVKTQKAKAEKPKPPKSGVYKLPNQKGAPAGMTRYYCFDCSNPFPAPSSETHVVCPNKHSEKK